MPETSAMALFITFLTIVVVVLFAVVVFLLLYVLKTSGGRESRLMGLLESYAETLARLADQVQELVREISEISKRLERLEFWSRGSGINNSGTMTVGRDAVGNDKIG